MGHEEVDVVRYMIPETSKGGFRGLEVDTPLCIPGLLYTRFVTTAMDVLHRFAVPSLGVKLDAVPGRLNQQFVLPRRLGVFYGQCSEICGANHRFMPIRIEIGLP